MYKTRYSHINGFLNKIGFRIHNQPNKFIFPDNSRVMETEVNQYYFFNDNSWKQ